MKSMKLLTLLAAVAVVGVAGASSAAEARRFHRHLYIGFAPVYPVVSYCKLYRTPWGLTRRCVY